VNLVPLVFGAAYKKTNEGRVSDRFTWRQAVASGLFHSGALGILRAVSREYEFARNGGRALPAMRRVAHAKFAILCYHRVGTEGIPLFSRLEPAVFEEQMLFLRTHYRVVSMDQLCDGIENPRAKGLSVAITFDDGYRDLYTHAFPVLKKYEIPAMVYLPVQSIEAGEVPWYDRIFLTLRVLDQKSLDLMLDRPRRFTLVSHSDRMAAAAEIIAYLRRLPDRKRREFCDDLAKLAVLPREELEGRMLTWEQIQCASGSGIMFGSHTMSHPVVSRLTPEERHLELFESRRILEERVGKPVEHFAYPFGKEADCGAATHAVLRRCGYRSAATMMDGLNRFGDDLYHLHRVSLGDERLLPMFAFKINQLFFSAGLEAGTTPPLSPTS
jgi:peptidoglycan/xylan/chitin deacetylase (PgdA/CDA1 family)